MRTKPEVPHYHNTKPNPNTKPTLSIDQPRKTNINRLSYRPAQEISVLPACAQKCSLKGHADETRRARDLLFYLSLHYHRRLSYSRATEALISLHICAGSSEPSLLDYTISTKSLVLAHIYQNVSTFCNDDC